LDVFAERALKGKDANCEIEDCYRHRKECEVL
jgi:hypothetical protein